MASPTRPSLTRPSTCSPTELQLTAKIELPSDCSIALSVGVAIKSILIDGDMAAAGVDELEATGVIDPLDREPADGKSRGRVCRRCSVGER